MADEPTGNLDATLAAEVMGLFRRFNEVGVTVLVATHDLPLVRDSGLREITLAEGQLGAEASRELIAAPTASITDGAGLAMAARLLTGSRVTATRWSRRPVISRGSARRPC